MGFEKVYRKWEKSRDDRSNGSRRRFERWLEAYPPPESPKASDEVAPDSTAPTESNAERRRRLRELSPQRQLDLHGVRAADAQDRIDTFLNRAVADGLSKVLIVHGKGKHSTESRSNGTNVMKTIVAERLRAHPYAGESGVPHRDLGGSGAVWVILRNK